jgi:hypothetical protein
MKRNFDREAELYQSLMGFYEKNIDEFKTKIIPILNRESKISLRLIEHFVLKYSQSHHLFFITDGRPIFLYEEYKNKLKSYRTDFFDPVLRSELIDFGIKTKSGGIVNVKSGLCQLNYFRWIMERNILNIIESRFDDIKHHLKFIGTTQDDTANTDSVVGIIDTIDPTHDVSQVKVDEIYTDEYVDCIIKFGI